MRKGEERWSEALMVNSGPLFDCHPPLTISPDQKFTWICVLTWKKPTVMSAKSNWTSSANIRMTRSALPNTNVTSSDSFPTLGIPIATCPIPSQRNRRGWKVMPLMVIKRSARKMGG